MYPWSLSTQKKSQPPLTLSFYIMYNMFDVQITYNLVNRIIGEICLIKIVNSNNEFNLSAVGKYYNRTYIISCCFWHIEDEAFMVYINIYYT